MTRRERSEPLWPLRARIEEKLQDWEPGLDLMLQQKRLVFLFQP